MKLQRYDIDFREIGQYVSPVEVPQNYGKYCKSEDVRKFENAVLKYVKENSILPKHRDKFIKKWRLII